MTAKIIVRIPETPCNFYPVIVRENLLEQPAYWLPKKIHYSQIVIITDHKVKNFYSVTLSNILKKLGYNVLLISFSPGEKSKHAVQKRAIEKKMLQKKCDKDILILALGGGVVGDLAGFVAATYLRGVHYFQLPTTLLAMIDSSVGGKTAINTPEGKNLIGTFWQPKSVIIDINCLKTLPKKQMINGLVEGLKIFLVCDKKNFYYTEKNISTILTGKFLTLSVFIKAALRCKIAIVKRDERERGQRAILNFGHTIGHAIERISQYKIMHGIAVGYGILIEAKISQLLGFLNASEYLIIQMVLIKLGFTGKILKNFAIEDIIKATHNDKKNRLGKVQYVILEKIGKVKFHDNHYTYNVSDSVVKQAFLEIMRK